MHSRIFVITSEKAKEVEKVEIPDWFVGRIADYVVEQTKKAFKSDIEWLGTYSEVLTINDNTFSFADNYKVKYFENKYKSFITALRQLEDVDVEQFAFANYELQGKIFYLNSLYEEEYEFYIYDIDNDIFAPMDKWIRFYSKNGVNYTIKQTFDYHY